MWSGAILEALMGSEPETHATIEDLRPHLQDGFPWHHPEICAEPNRPADQWWEDLYPVIESALQRGAGCSPDLARDVARTTRSTYTDHRKWSVFDDVFPTLHALSQDGWQHVILTNHVPEFNDILEHLALRSHFLNVFNSAQTGVEKPHPMAFRNVLNAYSNISSTWMIGDSMRADIKGAEAVGIPAILVRKKDPTARLRCTSLIDVPELLLSQGDEGSIV
jgi:putative hydrolase of the HAD superfamily